MQRRIPLCETRSDRPARTIYMVFTDSDKNGLPNVDKFDTEYQARIFATKHNGRLRPPIHVGGW